MRKFKVMVRRHGKLAVYRVCETREEANIVMTNLNDKLVNKAYKRAIKRGKRGIGHAQWQHALSQTAIQY